MACGGQGDVLSGVIGALLASGSCPLVAAARGAWLCGRASEIALSSRTLSEESLLPQDTLAHLGSAFLDWREQGR
jgi:NAD(P)H-hydrate epimerase